MSTWRRALHRISDETGATLAEFAFSLPFLVVIIYAVFDFGGALTLKQKLGASVAEAARTASSQSTADLSSSTVATNGSIADIRDTLAHHLQSAGVDDCGLLGAAPQAPVLPFQWVYNVTGGACSAPLILTVNRQQVVPVTSGGVTTKVIYTQVRLDYPFQWRLSKVIQLLVPSGTFPASSTIAVEASMQNLT